METNPDQSCVQKRTCFESQSISFGKKETRFNDGTYYTNNLLPIHKFVTNFNNFLLRIKFSFQ